MPFYIEYKLNFLLKNLFWFEFFALFRPTDFEIDLFKLFKARDCGVYTSYYFPCGIHNKFLPYVKNRHMGWAKIKATHAPPPHPDIKKRYNALFNKACFFKLIEQDYDMGNYWCNPQVFNKWWQNMQGFLSDKVQVDYERRDRLYDIIKLWHCTADYREANFMLMRI